MNRQVEANLSMVVSKALGGLNMNALKYILQARKLHYPSEMAALYFRGFRYLWIYVFLFVGYQ